jgi:F420-dependent oxidoreductase-like protein
MTAHPIRFGIQTGQQMVEWSQLLDLWKKADAWGYDSLWAFDHFYPIFVDPEGPCLEGLTTLAALAQATKRARVGTLVLGNTYRHPSLTAKSAATLDHVSGGRFNLGIGAGWFELEHTTLGFDFKDVPGRLAALDEALEIIKGLWTREKTTVAGKHYQVTDAFGSPKPLQKPHPPILIGGQGRKVLLKIVAKHADMWNYFGSPAEMKELSGVIDRHCATVKRDPAEIERTHATTFGYGSPKAEQAAVAGAAAMWQLSPEAARERVMVGSKQECLDRIGRYRQAGITHFLFFASAPYDLDGFQAFVEDVVPAAKR